MTELQPWVIAILAHPITKQPCKPEAFNSAQGVIDARVFLKNTHGYSEWAEGQEEYEGHAKKGDTTLAEYQTEIEGARPIYQHYLVSIQKCQKSPKTSSNNYQKRQRFALSADFWSLNLQSSPLGVSILTFWTHLSCWHWGVHPA